MVQAIGYDSDEVLPHNRRESMLFDPSHVLFYYSI